MKLSEYVLYRNLPITRTDFDFIQGFTFGEAYAVILGTRDVRGGLKIDFVIEFDALATALNMIADEFEAQPDMVPGMTITTGRDIDRVLAMPTGTAKGPTSMSAATAAQALASTSQTPGLGMRGTADERVLLVRPEIRSPAFERPTMECYVEMFREQITLYNLTQSWDQMEGRANL